MATADEPVEFLPDRLNDEPAVFKGCSVSELTMLAIIAGVVWLPISLIVAAIFGAITMGFGMAGVGVVGTVVLAAGRFQKLKSGRPSGFYIQQFRCWLDSRGLIKAPYIRQSGYWDIGRTE